MYLQYQSSLRFAMKQYQTWVLFLPKLKQLRVASDKPAGISAVLRVSGRLPAERIHNRSGEHPKRGLREADH
jgi:hypothetical protein